MTKIFEVKGVKGLRKLMKEIAITASTGKHDNELIGTSNIPLKVSYSFKGKSSLKINDIFTFNRGSFLVQHARTVTLSIVHIYTTYIY